MKVFYIAAILCVFGIQCVASSPRMRIKFSNFSYTSVPTICNITATLSNSKINLTLSIVHPLEAMFLDVHLDVKMLNKPSSKFERFFDKSLNFCDVMSEPLTDPLIRWLFNRLYDDKRNKMFNACPVPAVGLQIILLYFNYNLSPNS